MGCEQCGSAALRALGGVGWVVALRTPQSRSLARAVPKRSFGAGDARLAVGASSGTGRPQTKTEEEGRRGQLESAKSPKPGGRICGRHGRACSGRRARRGSPPVCSDVVVGVVLTEASRSVCLRASCHGLCVQPPPASLRANRFASGCRLWRARVLSSRSLRRLAPPASGAPSSVRPFSFWRARARKGECPLGNARPALRALEAEVGCPRVLLPGNHPWRPAAVSHALQTRRRVRVRSRSQRWPARMVTQREATSERKNEMVCRIATRQEEGGEVVASQTHRIVRSTMAISWLFFFRYSRTRGGASVCMR